MSPRPAFLSLLTLLIFLAPQASASPPPPTALQGTYDGEDRIATLDWVPSNTGSVEWNYLVWRDGTLVGETTGTSFEDMPPGIVPDPGFIYFVSAAPPGEPENYGLPAVVGVPTLSCEVVSVSTSWEYPYLYAHLHEECIGGTVTYEKDAVWTAPQ